MNRRAYLIGVVYVFVTMAAAVVVRSFAEAAFLDAHGVRYLPHFFLASALAFGGASLVYDRLAGRVRGGALDGTLVAAFALATAAAPWLVRRGGAAVFATALLLIGLSSVANLAAWNGVASTVMGRTARRFLPRAGAAVTAGAMLAGFGSSAYIKRAGLTNLPYIALGLAVAMFACGLALARATAAAPAPRPAGGPGPAAGVGPAPMTSTTSTTPTTSRGLGHEARRLVRWLAIAAIAEAAIGTVIELQFSSALKARYSGADLGAAIALFYGVSNAVLLVLQLLAVPRLLVTRSLPVTASAHPVALLAVLGAVLAAPGLLWATLARGTDGILRAATSRTSQEISLSVLGPVDRPRWKLLLRGVATPLGTAAAGALVLMLPTRWLTLEGLAGVALVGVAAWLLVVRRMTRAYLATLADPLGMKQVALGDDGAGAPVDLDDLRALIERAGGAEPDTARLGSALLARTGHRADDLVPHLSDADAAGRGALYTLAARNPHPSALGDLRAAVAAEDDDDALAAGLAALAAHGDDGAAARAGELASPRSALGRAATAYLAQAGRLDPAATWSALRALLDVDGAWAGRLARANRDRLKTWPKSRTVGGPDALRASPSDWAGFDLAGELAERLTGATPLARAQAHLCALVAAEPAALAAWQQALAAGDAAATLALASCPDDAFAQVTALTGADHPPALRARLARALRGAPPDRALPLLIRLLADAEPAVRDQAARSLAALRRAGRGTAPREVIDRAIDGELDRLEDALDARAAAAAHSPFGAGELARHARRCRSRALTLVGLQGAAAAIAAAERRLRSREEPERRRALDVLQEVARASPRLLNLVERSLTPPRPAPGAPAPATLDPWLARVFSDQLGAAAPRLAALRACPLLDDLPGDDLADLAARANDLALPAGAAAVHEGEPGAALALVVSGELAIERGGRPAGRLAPGDSFGELTLIDDAPRSATVRAVTDAQLLLVPRAAFADLLDRCPELGLALLRTLTAWLRG